MKRTALILATALSLVAVATPAQAATSRPTQVTVRSGNTLSGIAVTLCGRASAYPALAVGNGIRNANLIYPGQVIRATCTAKGGTSTSSGSKASPTVSKGWVSPLARTLSLTTCWGAGRNHKGLDMDQVMGYPVRAAAAGVVRQTGWVGSGYGIEVTIYHGGGVWTHSAHLSSVSVHPGQSVKAGQQIGRVGNTGDVWKSKYGDGSHLHFEVETGNYSAKFVFGRQINPAPWLRSHGVSIGC